MTHQIDLLLQSSASKLFLPCGEVYERFVYLSMKVLFANLALLSQVIAGPVLDIVSKNGKSLEAEIIAVGDSSVTLKRTTDQKVFELAFEKLSAGTVEILKKTKDSLGTVHPEYEFDVSIGKRRKRQETSYRMMDMEITSKVSVRNLDAVMDSPGMKVRMIYVGEQQGKDNVYEILNVADFEMAPKVSKTEVFEPKSFKTEYDNKKGSYGYWGGKEFAGYVLLVADSDGEVFYTKTLTKSFQEALDSQPDLIERLLKIRKGALVKEDFGSVER